MRKIKTAVGVAPKHVKFLAVFKGFDGCIRDSIDFKGMDVVGGRSHL
jgi:hypothetical protein